MVFLNNMNLAVLFSGGKDSMYSIYLSKKQGHKIKCMLTILPKSDESHLLHYPNLQWTSLQSESMGIPQLLHDSKSDDVDAELKTIEELLKKAIKDYGVEGLVHGGIHSKFQKQKFEQICKNLNVVSLAPLWQSDPNVYIKDLILSGFTFVMTSVSSGGLDEHWLGKEIVMSDLDHLTFLSEKFGFNLNFEGGEAETFVVNCPLFSIPIKIYKSEKCWDGYRGRFEIIEAGLDYNA